MKRFAKCLVCAGLIAMVGCTNSAVDRRTTAQKPPKVQPTDDDAPPVAKLVPLDQLNDKNANVQADALYRDLIKDSNREISPTSTASAGGDEPPSR
jgi:hypothetical protein